MKENNLPDFYSPYHELTICSNYFINVQIPFVIDGNVIMLIGRGKLPKIWLSTPESDRKKWVTIIKNNQIYNPALYLRKDITNKSIDLKIASDKALSIKELNRDKSDISYIDLRMIGLEI